MSDPIRDSKINFINSIIKTLEHLRDGTGDAPTGVPENVDTLTELVLVYTCDEGVDKDGMVGVLSRYETDHQAAVELIKILVDEVLDQEAVS